MKGIKNNKSQKNDKQFPGCLGRVVNLFDLSAGISSNRLLTDKPHRDGSLSRSRSDVAHILNTPHGNRREDKMVYPDLRSLPSQKSHSSPMKTLMAQEMSKEIKPGQSSSNVVAKLMGLDALPCQQEDGVVLRTHSHYDYPDRRLKLKAFGYEDQCDYRDVYEVQNEYQKLDFSQEKSPRRATYSERETKKKMELVRRKFTEAKRLATNEKLCQSKEFQDAVEILSSNKEFFLKFLQEPNALISKHVDDLPAVCAPPETKRITVLKPSKLVDVEKFPTRGRKNDYPVKRPAQVVQETYLTYDIDEYADQPSRIVVLKPNAGKMSQIKSSVSVVSPSLRTLHGKNKFESEDCRINSLGYVVEENSYSLGDRRDEIPTSSAFREDTSFDELDDQYAPENFSDYEVVSPNSRHSWDYVNAFGSPFSSFGRRSSFPDSSVSGEARKRLSERWAVMALGRGALDGRRGQRSSNTLGEMLALADMKKSLTDHGERKGGEEVSAPRNCSKSFTLDMPVSLQRSRSLPSSSIHYDQKINLKDFDPEVSKIDYHKEATKKNATSFKGKVSSFFLRNKKSSKDKYAVSPSMEESESAASDTQQSSSSAYSHNKVSYYVNECAEESQQEECASPGLGFPSRSLPDSVETAQKQVLIPTEIEMSNLGPGMPGNSIENPDQPSPISVLELPYEEEDNSTPESSGKLLPTHHPMSNLINKSPPIESVSRTLSWDDSCSGSASPSPTEPALLELVEQDWLLLVMEILSAAGLDQETQQDVFQVNWHSLVSPLDPLLLEKLVQADEEPMHEARRRQLRSNRKLVFDCVNEAIIEFMGSELKPVVLQAPFLLPGEPPASMQDRVWSVIKQWLSCEVVREVWNGNGRSVEVAVREEAVTNGGWWDENFRLEIGNVGKDIEQELLRELVDETLYNLQ